jgi:hypothetical protein
VRHTAGNSGTHSLGDDVVNGGSPSLPLHAPFPGLLVAASCGAGHLAAWAPQLARLGVTHVGVVVHSAKSGARPLPRVPGLAVFAVDINDNPGSLHRTFQDAVLGGGRMLIVPSSSSSSASAADAEAAPGGSFSTSSMALASSASVSRARAPTGAASASLSSQVAGLGPAVSAAALIAASVHGVTAADVLALLTSRFGGSGTRAAARGLAHSAAQAVQGTSAGWVPSALPHSESGQQSS